MGDPALANLRGLGRLMRHLLLVLTMLLSAAVMADDPACPPNYGYSGYLPPSQWRFVKDWECGTEPLQSPIDLSAPFSTERKQPIAVRYESMPLTVLNSGHDYRVIPTRENSISIGEIHALLDEFHFHVPSEHTMGNRRYAGEIHFVHTDTKTRKRFVIAVLLRRTRGDNKAFDPIIEELPLDLCVSKETEKNLAPLLPKTIDHYYRYIGSLTTPACDGDVTFFVLPATMSIGHRQLDALLRFGENARTPVQSRAGRIITHVLP